MKILTLIYDKIKRSKSSLFNKLFETQNAFRIITKQLTEAEFKNTFTDSMLDVTVNAFPTVDIWSYVQELVAEKIVTEYVYDRKLVELVYRNNENAFDHVLLPTNSANVFIVIIVDLEQKNINGYFKLDLNKEHGLDRGITILSPYLSKSSGSLSGAFAKIFFSFCLLPFFALEFKYSTAYRDEIFSATANSIKCSIDVLSFLTIS